MSKRKDNDLGIFIAIITIIAAWAIWMAGMTAGVNHFQRQLCIEQGYEWINETPAESPVAGLKMHLGVTCIEPIERLP